MSQNILEEAIKVTEERQTSYDKPEDNFQRIANLWNVFLEDKGIKYKINPADVSMMMILMKVARQQWKHSRDNLTDLCGYAHCLARIEGEYDKREVEED